MSNVRKMIIIFDLSLVYTEISFRVKHKNLYFYLILVFLSKF